MLVRLACAPNASTAVVFVPEIMLVHRVVSVHVGVLVLVPDGVPVHAVSGVT